MKASELNDHIRELLSMKFEGESKLCLRQAQVDRFKLHLGVTDDWVEKHVIIIRDVITPDVFYREYMLDPSTGSESP